MRHRQGLIKVYESQLEDAAPFMKSVLHEALRRLKYTNINSKDIEDWVITLEKSWGTIKPKNQWELAFGIGMVAAIILIKILMVIFPLPHTY